MKLNESFQWRSLICWNNFSSYGHGYPERRSHWSQPSSKHQFPKRQFFPELIWRDPHHSDMASGDIKRSATDNKTRQTELTTFILYNYSLNEKLPKIHEKEKIASGRASAAPPPKPPMAIFTVCCCYHWRTFREIIALEIPWQKAILGFQDYG